MAGELMVEKRVPQSSLATAPVLTLGGQELGMALVTERDVFQV